MNNPILQATGLKKSYGLGGTRLDVLRGVDVKLNAGEMVALVGPSGSGKSTLLHVIGLLDRFDEGQIIIDGQNVEKDEVQRTALRCKTIGFVYQFHHLLPEFSALENVTIPQMLAGKTKKESDIISRMLLDKVSLSARAKHRPSELSGGEQQRVAIARALANQPRLLIADEPTGNLDLQNSSNVFNILRDICLSEGVAILMATHNLELAHALNRVIVIQDGLLAS
jgi:lipoprotein-releasing system ATP-binding protein